MRDFHGLSILCMNYPDEVDHDLTDVTGMMCFTSGIPEVAVSDFQVSESLYTIQIYWNNTIQIMPDYNILSIIISQMMLDDTRTIQIYPIYWGLRPPQAVTTDFRLRFAMQQADMHLRQLCDRVLRSLRRWWRWPKD